MGRFDSFDDMARAHGRSPTASWLLVTLFCDVFDLNDVYMGFPRNWDGSCGWDQMVQRYRAAFHANSIHPYQVLLELPPGRTYITLNLDPVCEELLTRCTRWQCGMPSTVPDILYRHSPKWGG